MSRKPKAKTGGEGRGTRSDHRKAVSGPERERLRQRIAIALDACPYKKVELAGKLGVCPSSISKWMEEGGALPGLDVVAPLAMALGVSPGWFWTDEPPPIWDIPRPKPISASLNKLLKEEMTGGGPCIL